MRTLLYIEIHAINTPIRSRLVKILRCDAGPAGPAWHDAINASNFGMPTQSTLTTVMAMAVLDSQLSSLDYLIAYRYSIPPHYSYNRPRPYVREFRAPRTIPICVSDTSLYPGEEWGLLRAPPVLPCLGDWVIVCQDRRREGEGGKPSYYFGKLWSLVDHSRYCVGFNFTGLQVVPWSNTMLENVRTTIWTHADWSGMHSDIITYHLKSRLTHSPIPYDVRHHRCYVERCCYGLTSRCRTCQVIDTFGTSSDATTDPLDDLEGFLGGVVDHFDSPYIASPTYIGPETHPATGSLSPFLIPILFSPHAAPERNIAFIHVHTASPSLARSFKTPSSFRICSPARPARPVHPVRHHLANNLPTPHNQEYFPTQAPSHTPRPPQMDFVSESPWDTIEARTTLLALALRCFALTIFPSNKLPDEADLFAVLQLVRTGSPAEQLSMRSTMCAPTSHILANLYWAGLSYSVPNFIHIRWIVVGSSEWLAGMELAREKVAMVRALDPASTLLTHSPTYPTLRVYSPRNTETHCTEPQKWPRMPSLSALEVSNLFIASCPAMDKISPDTTSDEVKVVVYEPEEVSSEQFEDGTAPSPSDVEIAPWDPSPHDLEESLKLRDDPSYPLESDIDELCCGDGATASKGPSSRDQSENPDGRTCDSGDDRAVASLGPSSHDLDISPGACDEDWENEKPGEPCRATEYRCFLCASDLPRAHIRAVLTPAPLPHPSSSRRSGVNLLTSPIVPILCAPPGYRPSPWIFNLYPPYAFSLTSLPCINSPRTASRTLGPTQVIYPQHISILPTLPPSLHAPSAWQNTVVGTAFGTTWL
ncbi:hypothetical protein BC834DRAFT_847990 [Gloeopeniophorella convolvens]|nr:hypothetical protein BC834DRAFT_847990 [Gloeopeniophorella convolvens]